MKVIVSFLCDTIIFFVNMPTGYNIKKSQGRLYPIHLHSRRNEL